MPRNKRSASRKRKADAARQAKRRSLAARELSIVPLPINKAVLAERLYARGFIGQAESEDLRALGEAAARALLSLTT